MRHSHLLFLGLILSLGACAAPQAEAPFLVVQCSSGSADSLRTVAYGPRSLEVTTQDRRTVLHLAERGQPTNDVYFDRDNVGRCIVTAATPTNSP